MARSSGNLICKKCGTELGRPAEITPEMKVQCGQCGHQMTFRSKAHATAPANPPPQRAPEPVRGGSISPLLLVMAAGLMVGVGVGIGLGVSFYLNSEKPEATTVAASSAEASETSESDKQKTKPDSKTSSTDQAAENKPTEKTGTEVLADVDPAKATSKATAATETTASKTNTEMASASKSSPANTEEKPEPKQESVAEKNEKKSPAKSKPAPASSDHLFLAKSGQQLAVGQFVSFDGSEVTIRQKTNTVKIAIEMLRDQDQKFVLDQPPATRTDLPTKDQLVATGRVFQSESGKQLAVGTFVAFDGSEVTIKQVDKEVKVSIDQLSEADQKFVFDQPADNRTDLPTENKLVESGRRFLSQSGKELATGTFVSFDGSNVTIKQANKEVKVPIDQLSEADQKFVFDQPPATRADLPPENQLVRKEAPERMSAEPQPVPEGLPEPPGFPLVRNWMGNNDMPLLQGKFDFLDPQDDVIIRLVDRVWKPVDKETGEAHTPVRGTFWIFFAETAAPAPGKAPDPNAPMVIMVRIHKVSGGHVDLPRDSFQGIDKLYLDQLESMQGFAVIRNNIIRHYSIPLVQFDATDQAFIQQQAGNPLPEGAGPEPGLGPGPGPTGDLP